MGTTHLQRAARVRIESNGERRGTRILVDGNDVSNDVVTVTWSVDANDRRPPTATVTFIQADIDVETELASQTPAVVDGLEFRALDLTVLDIKPGDKILIRSALHITDAEIAAIEKTLKGSLPGHQVIVIDGGLELSVLRPEGKAERTRPDQP
jgi:hypothetical protein